MWHHESSFSAMQAEASSFTLEACRRVCVCVCVFHIHHFLLHIYESRLAFDNYYFWSLCASRCVYIKVSSKVP